MGFLNDATPAFVQELWGLLLSAQVTIGGIPLLFLEEKKAEISRKRVETFLAGHYSYRNKKG